MHLSLLVLARADSGWPVGCQWAARPLAPGRAPSRLGPDSESPPGAGMSRCVCAVVCGPVRASACHVYQRACHRDTSVRATPACVAAAGV